MNKKVLSESFKGTGYQRLVESYLDEQDSIEAAAREVLPVIKQNLPNWKMEDAGSGEFYYTNGKVGMRVTFEQ